MQVGIFHKVGDELRGQVHSLTLSFELVFIPVVSRSKSGPSYKIMSGATQVGRAWPKTPGDLSFLKVKFDDPTFPAPFIGEMTSDAEGNYVLVWKRPGWRV
jgi:uncharacterized protein (DUF736 family)